MQSFQDKVAVITGAASGIGRAIAERCAQEGMKVVLADVEVAALQATRAALQATGATVLAVPTNVADSAAVTALAETTLATFGAVHLLCNNAGVAASGPVWEYSVADWEWVLGVNLWGVIPRYPHLCPDYVGAGGRESCRQHGVDCRPHLDAGAGRV